jgi:hypothetical protein
MLVLISVLSADGSSCQEATGTATAESVTAHLTGGGQRAWVKTPEEIILAKGAPQCVRGEIWTFGHDGKGGKRTCENGVVRERKFTWAWVGTQDDQTILQVDETRYIAELRQRKAKVEGDPPELVTVLRTPRTSQDTPVKEITLKFQDM